MIRPEPDCSKKLKALSDETRWQIVGLLLERPLTVTEIASQLEASQYNISKHLRILREAGLIVTAKEGRHVRSEVASLCRCKYDASRTCLDLGWCQFYFEDPPDSGCPPRMTAQHS